MVSELQPKGLDLETTQALRAADSRVGDRASEIARRATPTHVSAGVEVNGIQISEAVEMEKIAKEVRRGPSHSIRRRRFKNGSHTEFQTTTTGSDGVSSTVQIVDAEGEAARLLDSYGESSESFLRKPLSRGTRSRTADRLASVYKELGVAHEDIEIFRHVIRTAETPTTLVPDRPANEAKPVVVGELTKNVALQALEGLRNIRSYLAQAKKAKA